MTRAQDHDAVRTTVREAYGFEVDRHDVGPGELIVQARGRKTQPSQERFDLGEPPIRAASMRIALRLFVDDDEEAHTLAPMAYSLP
jgi:hypothetical protein